MPRDKVGLVGRNGAGKTSLFRVLGGETEPSAGRVVRKGAFGYLPQDPRIAGVLDGRTAVAHILSGRGIDAELERHREAAHRHGGAPRRAQRRPVHARRGAVPHERRVRGRQRGPRPGGRAGDRPEPHRAPDRRAVRRRAPARRARPHPVRRQRRAVPRRADEPPRRRRQGVADGLPARLSRRAARHQPRPRPARRGDHARPPPRPPGRRRHRAPRRVQGHVHAVPRVASRRRGAAVEDGGPAVEGDRPAAEVRRPLRGQGHEGGRRPQHGEADRPPRGRQGRRRPRRQGAARAVPSRRRRRGAPSSRSPV